MKVLLIGNTKSHSTKRLAAEFIALKDTFQAVAPNSLYIKAKTGAVNIYSGDINLKKFDIFIFRGVWRYRHEMNIIAQQLKQKGKIIIEECLAKNGLPHDKLLLDVASCNIPIIPFTFFLSLKQQSPITKFPIILKGLSGGQGKSIFKIDSAAKLLASYQKIKPMAIIQNFFSIPADYRVLIIGQKVIGAIKRSCPKDNWLTTAKGGGREMAKLPAKVLKDCLRATKIHGLEIAGVDILAYNKKYYLIEINASPQFKVFEKITGINVAQKIALYARGKFKANQ